MSAAEGRAPSTLRARSANLTKRYVQARLFQGTCAALTGAGVLVLFFLLFRVALQGLPWLDLEFLTSFPSRNPEKAGVLSALTGSLWLIVMTALISIPLGVASAVYLEEYAKRGRLSRMLEVNLANLAGVPSIIYGILGLAVFVRSMGLDRSLLAGAFTMSLLVLPVIIVASREASRSVPVMFRHAAYALGGTKWQTVRHHVLPAALPGILTGVILAISRAMGETAPLLVIGAFSYVAFVPENPLDDFTALPIQIFTWASRPQDSFHALAAAAIIALLAVLLVLNASAVLIRYQSRRNRAW
jgi:phosphate transport system permease protein